MGWFDYKIDAKKVLALYKKGFRDINVNLVERSIEPEFFLTEEEMMI
jgi:hypothetical protein